MCSVGRYVTTYREVHFERSAGMKFVYWNTRPFSLLKLPQFVVLVETHPGVGHHAVRGLRTAIVIVYTDLLSMHARRTPC